MANILFEFDQFYHNQKYKQPIENAIKTLKTMDHNGHGFALLVTKNEEGLVVTKCGVPLLETMSWLHKNGVNNFNVATVNPKTVPDLITLEDLFEDEKVPMIQDGKKLQLSWYGVANKLVEKKFIEFSDFT